MIKVYLLDFSGAQTAEKHLSLLPRFVINTKNPHLRRERIFSYMLLNYAYGDFFSDGMAMPSIERDENGRPYFKDSDVDFNISHDINIAALAISDEGRVGIDVQGHSESVSKRLRDKVSLIYENDKILEILIFQGLADAEVIGVKYSENRGVIHAPIDIYDAPQKADFFSDWTLLEAISKADGRGLSLFSEIDFENSRFTVRRATVKDRSGNSYSLCIAKKQK